LVTILFCYIYQAIDYANGIKADTQARDSILDIKGIRLDSMGSVNYENYQKIKDSLDKNRHTTSD